MTEGERITFKFPDGILGFEDIREFVIFESGYEPFLIMESGSRDVSFLLTSPLFFLKEYDPKIQEYDWKDIKIENDNEEKAIFCILNMHVEDYKEITANLKAPIILNKKKTIGKQVIVSNEDYPIRYKVFKGNSKC